jgi:hypothetical protein
MTTCISRGSRHSRLLDKLRADSLHVFITLDHLGVVVGGSREWDVVLRRKLPSWCDLLERDLVAVTESAWGEYSGDRPQRTKPSLVEGLDTISLGNIHVIRRAHRQRDPHR